MNRLNKIVFALMAAIIVLITVAVLISWFQ
jgi:hypothetical protein